MLPTATTMSTNTYLVGRILPPPSSVLGILALSNSAYSLLNPLAGSARLGVHVTTSISLAITSWPLCLSLKRGALERGS